MDASIRGLSDGQRVVLKNERGELHTALHVTNKVCSGVVSLPGKWWSRPAKTGAVGNLLTPSVWSPGGQPAYNDTFVQVESATQ